MRGLRHVFRSLKHHVLKQVRETRAPFRLVARTNVVVNADGDNRHRLVLVQNDAQSILEGELFDQSVWNLKSFLHVESGPS